MTQTTKTQVVFPKSVLRELDQVVADRQRSQFVVAATRKELDRIHFKKTLKNVAGSWSKSSHPDLVTQRDVSAYIKKLRRPLAKRSQRFKAR